MEGQGIQNLREALNTSQSEIVKRMSIPVVQLKPDDLPGIDLPPATKSIVVQIWKKHDSRWKAKLGYHIYIGEIGLDLEPTVGGNISKSLSLKHNTHHAEHPARGDANVSVSYTITKGTANCSTMPDAKSDACTKYSVQIECNGMTSLTGSTDDVYCKFLVVNDPLQPSAVFRTDYLKFRNMSYSQQKGVRKYSWSLNWMAPPMPLSPYETEKGRNGTVPFVFEQLTISEQLFSLVFGLMCKLKHVEGTCTFVKLQGPEVAGNVTRNMTEMLTNVLHLPQMAHLFKSMMNQTDEGDGMSPAYKAIYFFRNNFSTLDGEIRTAFSHASLIDLRLNNNNNEFFGNSMALLITASPFARPLSTFDDHCYEKFCLGPCLAIMVFAAGVFVVIKVLACLAAALPGLVLLR